jgi:hypothetical protein
MPSTVASRADSYLPTVLLFAMLVAADALFILVHIVHAWTPFLDDSKYALDTDLGMAELYQYVKLLWLLGCLGVAFCQTRRGAFIAWAGFFALLLLDDVAQLHENGGRYFARALGLAGALGLRGVDYGELIVAAIIAAIGVTIVLATLRKTDRASRQLSLDMFALLCVLAMFAVALDAVHSFTYARAPALIDVLALAEDGGELVVVSAITAYAFDIASNSGQQRIPVWARLYRLLRFRRGLENP